MGDVFWRPIQDIADVMRSGEFCLVGYRVDEGRSPLALCQYLVSPTTGHWFLNQNTQKLLCFAEQQALSWEPTHFAKVSIVPPAFYSSADLNESDAGADRAGET